MNDEWFPIFDNADAPTFKLPKLRKGQKAT